MEKAKKSIVILGSGGMLGEALRRCIKGRYKIIPLNHKQCDITDKEKLLYAFRRFRPWVVINTAAYKDVDGCQRNKPKAFAVNARGAYNVARAAKIAKAVLIYISTDYVFNGKKDRPHRETDVTRPVNIYGRSKLRGEEFVKRLLENYIIIRTCWLFGSGRHNFVDDTLHRARSAELLKVVNDKFASPTYVNDLAGAILRIIEMIDGPKWRSSYYGVYHITNSRACSWYDYAKTILRLARIENVKVEPISIKEIKFDARRPAFSGLDNSKYNKLTNKPLRPWPEALKEYLKAQSLNRESQIENSQVS